MQHLSVSVFIKCIHLCKFQRTLIIVVWVVVCYVVCNRCAIIVQFHTGHDFIVAVFRICDSVRLYDLD